MSAGNTSPQSVARSLQEFKDDSLCTKPSSVSPPSVETELVGDVLPLDSNDTSVPASTRINFDPFSQDVTYNSRTERENETCTDIKRISFLRRRAFISIAMIGIISSTLVLLWTFLLAPLVKSALFSESSSPRSGQAPSSQPHGINLSSLTCQWLEGEIGILKDQIHGEIFGYNYMEPGGVNACFAKAREISSDGIVTFSQNGKQGCSFFNLDNFKPDSVITTFPKLNSIERAAIAQKSPISFILPLSDIWLKGQVGKHKDSSGGVLVNLPYLSPKSINDCKSHARHFGFNSFYATSQGGKMACVFFVTENMESQSVLRGFEQIFQIGVPDDFSDELVSYIMPDDLVNCPEAGFD